MKRIAWRSHVHINIISYLTEILVLSKMDCGLIIYGNSYKSNVNNRKSIYHQALRGSTHTFCTTPIKNIIAESGPPVSKIDGYYY